jgi:hypothetical protein
MRGLVAGFLFASVLVPFVGIRSPDGFLLLGLATMILVALILAYAERTTRETKDSVRRVTPG